MPANQNSNETTETALVKKLYASLNQNDIPAVVASFSPDVELIEPPEFSGAGTYRGLAVVKEHFLKARETWAEGSCEPERFFTAGDKVVVFVHVRVRLKEKTEWNEGHIADGYQFRNGQVIQMRTFLDRQQALDWAGIK